MNTATLAEVEYDAQENQDGIPTIQDVGPDTEELRQAEIELRKHAEEYLCESAKPLTVNEHGYIETGVLWIPPFVSDFWSGRRVKPKPTKCQCTCGHKHATPKGKEARS